MQSPRDAAGKAATPENSTKIWGGASLEPRPQHLHQGSCLPAKGIHTLRIPGIEKHKEGHWTEMQSLC